MTNRFETDRSYMHVYVFRHFLVFCWIKLQKSGGSKAANLSSTLIISCASTVQRNFPLLCRKSCGEDLAGVGGRSWMRLGASSLLLPRRRLRSDGRWSLRQEQQAPSAASWVTEQPYLGSTLLTSTRGGA